MYPREIYIVDLELGQTIGCVGGNSTTNDGVCDRPNGGLSPIVQAYPCMQRDAIYILHENGTVSLRTRRGMFTKASISRIGSSNFPRSISLTSSLMLSGDARTIRQNVAQYGDSPQSGILRDDNFLEISYDLKGTTCDSAIRLGSGAKGAKVQTKIQALGKRRNV